MLFCFSAKTENFRGNVDLNPYAVKVNPTSLTSLQSAFPVASYFFSKLCGMFQCLLLWYSYYKNVPSLASITLLDMTIIMRATTQFTYIVGLYTHMFIACISYGVKLYGPRVLFQLFGLRRSSNANLMLSR